MTTTDHAFPTSSVSPATPASPVPAPDTVSTSSKDTGKEVLDRVVQGAHSAIDRMAETAAPVVQRVQDGVNAASEAISQRATDAREMRDEWADSLRATVREHPLTAVVTALAVGVLLARATR